MNVKTVKLSCERCRRRKTKCDKRVPCSNCKNAGINCTEVERARLPRGPSGKIKNRNLMLENRVARLEDLLTQAARQIQPVGRSGPGNLHSADGTPCSTYSSRPPAANKITQLYAKEIWATLSEEVAGLRETLEASDEEDLSGIFPSNEAGEDASECIDRLPHAGLASNVLFKTTLQTAVQPPPANVRFMLLKIYQYRVDCLFKITHWPTVVAIIKRHYRGDDYQPSSLSSQALEFSIYFLAMCSITDQESNDMLSEDKNRQSLLLCFRDTAEMLIAKANLLHSPDLTLLQAFVIYLKGLRACMDYTTTWNSVATAVRVATALGLPAQEDEGWSAYELEVRRRIWYCISALDFQTAADRGSAPLVALERNASPPSLALDSELSSSASWQIPSQPDTDMSLAYVYREATECIKKLFPQNVTPGDRFSDWNSKLQIVAAFRECMKQHSSRIHNPADPFRLCAQFSTNALAMDMELFLRRPPFRVKHSPPPSWDDFEILKRTTEIMEVNLTKPVNTTFAPWVWFAKPWARWYILAVLMAELCTSREGDLADKAYTIAKENFALYGELIADTDLKLLWKPLVKLMNHVDRVRDQKQSVSNVSVPTSFPASSSPVNAVVHSKQHAGPLSRVVMSYDPDAAQRALAYSSTKIKRTTPDDNSSKSWNENSNDLRLTFPVDLMEESSPSRIWDFFLDDIGGFNRCFI